MRYPNPQFWVDKFAGKQAEFVPKFLLGLSALLSRQYFDEKTQRASMFVQMIRCCSETIPMVRVLRALRNQFVQMEPLEEFLRIENQP